MREILFRGKRTDNGEWVYGDLLNVGVDYDYAIRTYGGREHGQVNAVNENTVGEFTGLFDAKGKRVFEGDILVNTIKKLTKVTVETYIFVRDIRNIKGLPLYVSIYEVIGNIYDNPELLSKERA